MGNNTENSFQPLEYINKDVITFRYEYNNLTPRQQYKVREVVSNYIQLSNFIYVERNSGRDTPEEEMDEMIELCEKALILFSSNVKDLELSVDAFRRSLLWKGIYKDVTMLVNEHRRRVLEQREYFTVGSLGKELRELERDALKILPVEMKTRRDKVKNCIDTIEKNFNIFCDMVSRNISGDEHYSFVNKNWLHDVKLLFEDYYLIARNKLENPRCEYPRPDEKARTYIDDPFVFFKEMDKKSRKELEKLKKISEKNLNVSYAVMQYDYNVHGLSGHFMGCGFFMDDVEMYILLHDLNYDVGSSIFMMYQILKALEDKYTPSGEISWQIDTTLDLALKEIREKQSKFSLFKKKIDFDTPTQLIADCRNYIKAITDKIRHCSLIIGQEEIDYVLKHYKDISKLLDRQEKSLNKLKNNK